MKAYYVHIVNEPSETIVVFGDTVNQARRGLAKYTWVPYERVRAVRAPAFDGARVTGVPKNPLPRTGRPYPVSRLYVPGEDAIAPGVKGQWMEGDR